LLCLAQSSNINSLSENDPYHMSWHVVYPYAEYLVFVPSASFQFQNTLLAYVKDENPTRFTGHSRHVLVRSNGSSREVTPVAGR